MGVLGQPFDPAQQDYSQAQMLQPPAQAAPQQMPPQAPAYAPAAAPQSNFRAMLDPQVALPIAAALMGGRTLRDSLAGGMAAAAPGMAQMKQRSAVNAWLAAGAPKDPNHPAMKALMDANPALGVKYAADKLTPQASDMPASVQEYQYGLAHPDYVEQQLKLKSAASNPAEDDQAQAIADGIVNGDIPPTKNLYRYTAPVLAKLSKSGFNLTKQTEDFTATQKRLAVMNGSKQISMVNAINQVDETLPLIEQLATEWQGGGFKPLNKLNLEAARQGAYGQEAQSLATRLTSAIADITSELGTVYKGGNASTDESLRLAAENLKADWSAQTLLDNVKQVRQQLAYRKNSMKILTQGTPGNRYDQPVAPEAAPGAAPAAAAPAPAPGAPIVINGYTITPSP